MLGVPITDTRFGVFGSLGTVYAEEGGTDTVGLVYNNYDSPFYYVKLPTNGNKKVSTYYGGEFINTFRIL